MSTEIFFLRGKTQKGKNRVSELGEEWIRLLTRETVSFSSEKGWILLAPVKNTEKIRWIKASDDVDFEVRKVVRFNSEI